MRHFPDLFQDLSFININDDTKNLETLKIAAQRVVDLEKKDEYLQFKEQFQEEKGVFPFSRKTQLSIPPSVEPVYAPLPKEREEGKWTKSPFKTLCDLLFIRTPKQVQIPKDPPFLDQKLAPQPETLASEFVTKFTQGYDELKKRNTQIYTLQTAQLQATSDALLSEKTRIHTTACREEKAICPAG